MMRWLIVILFLISSPAMAASPFPQVFHTQGNRIVDESNQPVMFRGLGFTDPVWKAMGEDPEIGLWEEESFKIMADWGANIVRLSIHPIIWKHYGAEANLAVLDQAIAWAKKYKMYVVIDFHSIDFPPELDYLVLEKQLFGEIYKTTKAEIFNFWEKVSQRYAREKTVAFYELFNEAYRSADDPDTLNHWLTWKWFMEELIDHVRQYSPDKPVIVSGLTYGYDLSYVSQAPIQHPNVIYSTHPYPDANKIKSWDIAFGSISRTFPVMVTEFGFDNGTYTEKSYKEPQAYREAIIAYLEKQQISWIVWAFSPAFTPALLQDLNYTPSESGKFFKSKFKSAK